MLNPSLVKQGFIAAAIANISGVLIFSKGLTNTALMEADPVVMSSFGLIMIMVWGAGVFGGRFYAGQFALDRRSLCS